MTEYDDNKTKLVNKTVTKTDNKTKLVIITVTKTDNQTNIASIIISAVYTIYFVYYNWFLIKNKDFFAEYNTRTETLIW